jgi:hypothetical protein
LISLHNYFIMHGIKYFFLNKNNQTIQGGHVPKILPKNTIFQNPGGARAPPGLTWVRPCLSHSGEIKIGVSTRVPLDPLKNNFVSSSIRF